MACDPKAANKWTARIIPLILAGLIGYATWVLTELVCVKYLLNPPKRSSVTPRPGAAIVVLVLFYLLLLPVLVCFGRLIQTIVTNPGYTPLGPIHPSQTAQDTECTARDKSSHRPRPRPHTHPHGSPRHSHNQALAKKPLRNEPISQPEKFLSQAESAFDEVQDFWKRDVFICNFDGRPNWCSKCMNFKTNRTHHCSETDRCVQKMDHFCPWVGGIISETTFKYFIQFTTYAALFCTHIVITMAILVAERKRKMNDLNIHWCIILGVSALFLLFSSGMSLSSLQLALINSTTVENLSRRTKVWFIAVIIPRPQIRQNEDNSDLRMITYPRPFEEQKKLQEMNSPPEPRNGTKDQSIPEGCQNRISSHSTTPLDRKSEIVSPSEAASTAGKPVPPSYGLPRSADSTPEPRTFAILSSQPGQNPFQLGALDNLKEVLGYSYVDWVLPLRPSPCTDHSSQISAYRMGEVVEEMKRAAGLTSKKPSERNRRKRRRKSHLDAGEPSSANKRRHKSRSQAKRAP